MNKIRIISGSLRGRKIPVLDLEGLRPTTDRIRETLFNWLNPYIYNSVCLDLFAGTGALSFEALSRGAAKATLVDQSKEVITHLKKMANDFKLNNFEIVQAQIPGKLDITQNSIDIVFLDPPFRQNLIEPTCIWLDNSGWLKKNALIYLEMERTLKKLNLPKNWHIEKEKAAGQTAFYLVRPA